MVNVDEHPALRDEHGDLRSLTLVLPGGLDASKALRGLVASIGQARAGLAARVRRFRQLEAGYAASGDLLRGAVCRGQALGAERAMSFLDEEIVEAFGLWQQYEAQVPGPGDGGDRPAAPGCGPGGAGTAG